MLDTYEAERILIEPSGVGKLSDVMKAVQDVVSETEVRLNSAVAVVDVAKCKMYMKNFGEFFINQVEHEGTVILSRTGKISPEKLAVCVEMIREHNPRATIVTTPWEELDGKDILETIEGAKDLEAELMEEVRRKHEQEDCHHHDHGPDCTCGCHDHDHHADEVFSSWGMETVTPCSREKLEAILEGLSETTVYGDVLRAKGMLPTDNPGQWLYFDLVPEEYEIREGDPDYTGKVCVIGARLKEDELNKAFGRS